MAYLSEQATYEQGIYQIECTDPIQGGEDGISNVQAKQLANRTAYLKSRLEAAHNVDGTHKAAALSTSLTGALTDAEFAANANLNEAKLNLYFRGTPRPSNMGIYNNTREIAEDMVRLDTMNSLGDLMLNKTTLDTARNLCNQFYPSSGILYAGGTALSGYTPLLAGEVGGGVFTIDNATVDMSNKLYISGIIQHLIDGFCIRVKAPIMVSLPPANDSYSSNIRTDLVYMRTHLENVTLSDKFYRLGDVSGTRLNWSILTDTEKKVESVLIDNNLFIGADYNVYQMQYEWQVEANKESLTQMGYAKDVNDSYMFISGIYKAIEICTVLRRNKGAYHSVINPKGTGAFWGDSEVLEENQVEHSGPSYPITAVDTVNNTFTIVGNLATSFPAGSLINISGAINGADDNSRDYEVVSSTDVASDTVIKVTRDLTLNTGVHGAINKGWPASPFYSILGTDTTLQTFTIAGDHVSEFPAGFKMEVLGSPTNDKDYLVSACVKVGTDTVISVNTVILNTGNVGKLHALEWFHINYCFTHVASGLVGEKSGSVASGSVAASASSTKNEFNMAHDHILSTDLTDLRTFLATAERETDPNLTLNTPTLTGMSLEVYELDVVSMVIDPYSPILTYTIQAVNAASPGVAVGTLVRNGAAVTWTLPEVTIDTSVRLSISAVDSLGHISPTQNYPILVRNLVIAGDTAIVLGSSDWEATTGATVTTGFVATADNAVGLSNYVYQTTGEADWAKYKAKISRGLYKWTINGASTVSSLVLTGTRALAAGQLYAVKYAGSTSIVATTLGVTTASWNSGTTTNTLTLGTALAALPEMIWSWDGTVAIAVGTASEALVPETALVIDNVLTTTSQVVGSAALSRLWVTGGYHSKVKITVNGEVVEVPVTGVNEFSGVYTLQIPKQDFIPTTMVKPSCFETCVEPVSLVYNTVSTNIDAIYPEQVTFGNSIRSIKFKADMANTGGSITMLQADMWSEV